METNEPSVIKLALRVQQVRETKRDRDRQRQKEMERGMDGYCIINGLTITILWVNDM